MKLESSEYHVGPIEGWGLLSILDLNNNFSLTSSPDETFSDSDVYFLGNTAPTSQ